MRVLQVHNRYQQAGGEDAVARAERKLLEGYGHTVDLLEVDNSGIAGFAGKMKAALGTIYSLTAKRKLAGWIFSSQPDVVHVHNFFPVLSPSIYYACHEAHVPVVQTLHNYRLICPNGLLLRSGSPCNDCLGRGFAWPGVLHACYRGSHLGTASIAAMTGTHHWLGTWRNRVNAFIALTDFAKGKLAEGGLPPEKITVKPNFVTDPGAAGGGRGEFALFVGRLSSEKGIETLLSAWDRLHGSIPLKIAGEGPLQELVEGRTAERRIEYLGKQPRERVFELMHKAALLIFPSLCYENLPLAIAEAFACGLPVIVSQMGVMEEIVEDGRTGLYFSPGDAEDLAAKVEWAVAHPKDMAQMRREARAEYLAKYTPERNYPKLMEIYVRVVGCKHREAD